MRLKHIIKSISILTMMIVLLYIFIGEYSQSKWYYYTYKTWYALDEEGRMFTFSFSDIEKGNVVGDYNPYGFISAVSSNYYLTLEGVIENGKLTCRLNDGSGKGNLEISSFSKEKLEVEINYDYGLGDRMFNNGNYTFYPLAVEDLNYKIVDEDYSYTDIEELGLVRTITYEITYAFLPYATTFLVNEDNFIVFKFEPYSEPCVEILEKEYVDVNIDGLKDFIILYISEEDKYSKQFVDGKVFIYDDLGGTFLENKEMSNKIKVYGVDAIGDEDEKFKISYILDILY